MVRGRVGGFERWCVLNDGGTLEREHISVCVLG